MVLLEVKLLLVVVPDCDNVAVVVGVELVCDVIGDEAGTVEGVA